MTLQADIAMKPRPKASKPAAWLLWALLGWAGADRFYLRRWLEGIAQMALAAIGALLFVGRPTQVLLGQLGAGVVHYNANLIDLGGLWQMDVMLLCFIALAAWKLTDAANLNRAVDNRNRPAGTPIRRRKPLTAAGAFLVIGIAGAAGLLFDSLAGGFSAYIAVSMGLSGMFVHNLLIALRVAICAAALWAALRAASRTRGRFGGWLVGLPPALMLGLCGGLYYLLYMYFNLQSFAFLGLGPFSAEWLRGVLWNPDIGLLVKSASGDSAQMAAAIHAGLVQFGLGLAAFTVLELAAALLSGKKKEKAGGK
jgi:TM2 domain-containing membrane protein YozV